MKTELFCVPDPGEHLAFTGERYTSGMSGDIQNEHYHRYLFALRLCAGKDVLDVASGEGYGSALLAQAATSVVGVDIDERSVAFSRRSYRRDNLTFRIGSATELPLNDASVDTVVCFETIEHVVDHMALLHEVRRVLRDGGVFIVSTPDKQIYTDEPDYHNPFHLHELSREEFLQLLKDQFPHVIMCEQQVLAGSVISRLDPGSGGAESFSTTDGHAFLHRPALPRPPYLVAIASAAPVDLPSVSLLHGLRTDLVPSEPQVPELKKELAGLNEQLAQANLEAMEHRRSLLDLDHQRGFLRAMLTSARRVANQAKAEVVHARVEVERMQAIVDCRDADVEHARTEGLQQAQAQLATQLATAEADRARAEADMNIIRHSTSWKVTRPIRGIRFIARRLFR